MARGRGRGRGAAGKPGRVASGKTGFESYGQDQADEVLKLHEDAWSEQEGGDDDDWQQEEEVMPLKGVDDDEAPGKRKKDKKGKAKAPEEAAEEEDYIQGSRGWQRGDFYGGDDAGDDSEAGSDEDLTFKEAQKLEEIRAKRLQGALDPLAALLAPASSSGGEKPRRRKRGDDAVEGDDVAQATAASSAAAVGSQFDALFAAEVEKNGLQRDLAALPESQRKALLKKEAPELVPLLEDFKAKLRSLRQLAPLLSPKVFRLLPASGASYLESKASLLLNTLANLSFYLLVRAEGGDVRAHPVVSQLVWLRELHEQLAPLDKRLGSKVAKALEQASEALSTPAAVQEGDGMPAQGKVSAKPREREETAAEAPAEKKKLPLAERLAQLRLAKQPATGRTEVRSPKPAVDVLKMPTRQRHKGKHGNADAPDDLNEVDPTVGFWAPKSSLPAQLAEVQQQLRETAAKTKQVGSDVNVEARPRRARERVREEPEESHLGGRPASSAQKDDGEEEDVVVESDIVRNAKATSRAKKLQKETSQAIKDQLKLAKQHKPEKVVEGRRGTSKRILENRGLVRVRKSKAGNARLSNRRKFEKAVKRRRGAVQEMREGAADGVTYEGEATGVRTHLMKSRRLA